MYMSREAEDAAAHTSDENLAPLVDPPLNRCKQVPLPAAGCGVEI